MNISVGDMVYYVFGWGLAFGIMGAITMLVLVAR